MNVLLDILLNSNEYAKDSITMQEAGLEIQKRTFKLLEEIQIFLVGQYDKLETEMAREALKQGIQQGYVEMCKTDHAIQEAEKTLEETKQSFEKLV